MVCYVYCIRDSPRSPPVHVRTFQNACHVPLPEWASAIFLQPPSASSVAAPPMFIPIEFAFHGPRLLHTRARERGTAICQGYPRVILVPLVPQQPPSGCCLTRALPPRPLPFKPHRHNQPPPPPAAAPAGSHHEPHLARPPRRLRRVSHLP